MDRGRLLNGRGRLLDQFRPARKRAAGLRVEAEQALVDGEQVAARYRLIAALCKGGTITTEIYTFGELAANDRLRRAIQATRTIPSE
jgi:hypothetical protein